jgi:hypothetical protein
MSEQVSIDVEIAQLEKMLAKKDINLRQRTSLTTKMMKLLRSKRDTGNGQGAKGEAGVFAVSDSHAARRAEKILDTFLKRGHSAVFAEVVKLTPQLAELLMMRNFDNRPISPDQLRKLVKDIREDRFELNGETVILAKDGCLNDGQHRCMAVLETGTAVQVLMAFGVPRKARHTIGQGLKRSLGHYVHMQGGAYANQVAATAILLTQYKREKTISSKAALKPTTVESFAVIQDNPRLVESVEFVKSGSRLVSSIPTMAFAHFVFREIDEAQANVFIAQVMDGSGLSKTDPAYVCRERLMREKQMRYWTPARACECLFKCWNAFVTGQKMGRIALGSPVFPRI